MASVYQTMSIAIRVFSKDTMIDGRPARTDSFELNGQIYCLSRGAATVARLEHELYEDVLDPAAVIASLKDCSLGVDIFSFCQRVPDTEPVFPFLHEPEGLAALRVTTFDNWLNKQVKPTARNKVRKAQKAGVEVRE